MKLNPYAQLIADEAMVRGIGVTVLDPSIGEMLLSYGDRTVHTIESLSDHTSAVAFRRCDDKALTRTVFERAGLRLPPGRLATFDQADVAFLDEWRDIVVKPARGEGGEGVTVGVTDEVGLELAIELARSSCPDVLLEQRSEGEDLRIVVIDGEVVAASVRRPPVVVGDGRSTVDQLIDRLDSKRRAETGGSSRIVSDDVTVGVVEAGGHDMRTVLADGVELAVRRTANLHTGGTIHDVTEVLHPGLAEVAVRAAEAIGIPVLGLDLMVPAPDQADYVIIEANEQPGLANHEPQPTAERFIDLLFPETAANGPAGP